MIRIGLNHTDHAAEAAMAAPSEPIIFLTATTALCGAHDDIVRPLGSTKLDWGGVGSGDRHDRPVLG